MSEPAYITVKMLEDKLVSNYFSLSHKFPICLHAWPRCKRQGFCGIGELDLDSDDEPNPVGDVYVGKNFEHYDAINDMLKQACEKRGFKYLNMR
jgi:hypothetical protein